MFQQNRIQISEHEGSRLPDVLGRELSNIIEKRIVYLDLTPGLHLTEQEICDEFGISRSPVREAFRQLEAGGLVVRHARRGIRVKPMSEEDMHEIYACRIPLEGLAAASAANSATAEELDGLNAALDGMKKALKEKDVPRFFDHNVAFQHRLHKASGNSMLVRILAVMEKQAIRYRYFAHIKTEEMLSFSYHAQLEVYHAIRERRPEDAKRTAGQVMKKARQLIGDVLRQHGADLTLGARSPHRRAPEQKRQRLPPALPSADS